ncbi:hypothetical protein [Streptomyces sp. NBC_01716]|uniref:hypothetical protein n=1 Tax=Streptomyces sp. NBC_01716 TaxID=2975917 RepID=UPI002E375CB6|nr:hypothetical protein [Streptomyces sp. NBC_01716]
MSTSRTDGTSDGADELDAPRALLATVRAREARKAVRELLVRAAGWRAYAGWSTGISRGRTSTS